MLAAPRFVPDCIHHCASINGGSTDSPSVVAKTTSVVAETTSVVAETTSVVAETTSVVARQRVWSLRQRVWLLGEQVWLLRHRLRLLRHGGLVMVITLLYSFLMHVTSYFRSSVLIPHLSELGQRRLYFNGCGKTFPWQQQLHQSQTAAFK